MSIKVLFGPIRSCSVHIGLIWSTLILFCPFWSYSVHSVSLVLFGPIRSILCTLFHFSPIRGPIRSILVLFGSFCPLRSYSVNIALLRSKLVFFGPLGSLRSIRSYSVHLVLFGPPCSYLFIFCPFGPIQSIQITSVHIGLLQYIFVYLHNGKRHA